VGPTVAPELTLGRAAFYRRRSWPSQFRTDADFVWLFTFAVLHGTTQQMQLDAARLLRSNQ